MSAIGERLRAEREARRLSQEVFATLGGVKRNAQSNYESGERAPDADYLAALAAQGVDVLFVLTGVRSRQVDEARQLQERAAVFAHPTPPPVGDLSPAEAHLIRSYRRAADPDRAVIERVAHLAGIDNEH